VFRERGGVTLRRLLAFFSATGVEQQTPEVIQVAERADVSLPKEFKLIRDLDDNLREDLYAYLDSRGISKRIVRRARIGYCAKGKFWGYIVFPVFDNGEVVYWQARRYKNRTPKFWNPESSLKTDLVYRIGKSTKPRRIILVESILNALTLEPIHYSTRTDLVLALLGKTLSPIQMDKILCFERWVKEIVICLDPDAIRYAVGIAEQFVGRVPCTRVPIFPEKEDINSLGREKSWRIIWDAEVYKDVNRMKFLEHARIEE
jgi:hypothetical protein